MTDTKHAGSWSPISPGRYEQAQERELEYWSEQDRELLRLQATYYFYAGYYEWTKHGALLNPFSVNPSRPQNFQIAGRAMKGSAVLDVGSGPATPTVSLVHCAEVHAIDPLADRYREMQPFGWEFFSSVSSTGAEQLPFESASFRFVYCWNTLDHVQDADRVLHEIARVLVPDGRLLLGCDVRSRDDGGLAHPYHWTADEFEARLLASFTPVSAPALLDHLGRPVAGMQTHHSWLTWVGCLAKR